MHQGPEFRNTQLDQFKSGGARGNRTLCRRKAGIALGVSQGQSLVTPLSFWLRRLEESKAVPKTANTSEWQVTTSIKSWFPTGLDSSATLISKPIGRLEETLSNRAMDCQSLTRWGHIWGHLLVLNE
jgi:hypothetical protein